MVAVLLGWSTSLLGIEVVLKDGRVLKGKKAPVTGMNPLPAATSGEGPGDVPLIEVLDDDLRRTFVSIYQIVPNGRRPEQAGEVPEKIIIKQRVKHAGATMKIVGPILKTPFDGFGRRTVTMLTDRGELKIVQAITELTPTYTKVEGVTHVWDMRVATSSIEPKELATLLKAHCKVADIEGVKRIARFYVQCERYEDAAREIETFLAAHPNDADLKNQLAPPLAAIKQRSTKRLLGELTLRRDAGQHRFVLRMLNKFPTDETSGEAVQTVREMIRQYEVNERARKQTIEQIQALAKQVGDTAQRKRLEPIVREIATELNSNTLERMAAFRELADDQTLQPTDRLALAISGWLLGTKGANPRLSTALSLVEVRRLIVKYFAAPDKLSREEVLVSSRSEEAAGPAMVARLLAHMKPPVPADPAEEEGGPREFQVPGADPSCPAVRCLVQLPPEYDPHRRYPTVVTLHGPGFTSEQQIDWWAGPLVEGGWRAGHASRYGYIVVAPDWTLPHQKQYGYSAREHAAVLDCLRAACQRFSIDTDRVFLSGHSFGGDAAWDIGLGHPDLWAGVIPIAAKADKYCAHYWENAALLPFYFVCGELDSSRIVANSRDWDRYLKKGYNTTVVEYLGRGHENFSDEILRLFEWMNLDRLRRNFSPKQFTVATMRPWDNFFWWVEMRQFPPQTMVAPESFPLRRGAQAMHAKATVTKANGILLQTGAGRTTIWLSPDVLDLSRRFTITVNGGSVNTSAASLTGDLGVLLEDARTRGDRQHPFWSKLEVGR
jgi:pimeloyl-ACP methyl ester carboxylesterase